MVGKDVCVIFPGPTPTDLRLTCAFLRGLPSTAAPPQVRGVQHLHAHNLVHRDIKPENCVVESVSGRLLIIDFGLSKHQDSAVTLG